MTDNAVDGSQCIAVQRSFNDHPILAVPFDGDVVFVVAEVEAGLGYASKKLSNALGRWHEQSLISDNVHLRKLENGTLAAFKAAAGALLHIDAKTRHLLVLTKRGLYRVLQLSRQPKAVAFQDWLETEVLPSIEKTGRYDVASPPAPLGPPALPLPSPVPATSLDELRFRVEGLERLAASGQLDRQTATALIAQAAALLVAGAGGRGGDGPQLPALAMSGGEADAERPGLVPLAWATRFEALVARNQRPVPGLPRELEGKSPTDLWVLFGNLHHFLSDRAWRFLAHWMVEAGVVHYSRWLDLFDAAGKELRAAETTEPPRRRRARPAGAIP